MYIKIQNSINRILKYKCVIEAKGFKQVTRKQAGVVKVNADWVKLIYQETPDRANVKQGYLYEEGDFYKIIGDSTETLVRKHNVISITKKKVISHDKRAIKN